jgi:hypothetical protein
MMKQTANGKIINSYGIVFYLLSMNWKMSERAQKMWEAFCSELSQPPTDDMKEALATSLRTFADNMNGYPSILYKIADELGKMHINQKPHTLNLIVLLKTFLWNGKMVMIQNQLRKIMITGHLELRWVALNDIDMNLIIT